MATSGISNALNSKLRVSGLSSGLDTDSIIKALLAADRAKVDKVKQQKTLLQWKQDDYRTITTQLKSLTSTFMDVVNPSTNMRSASNYKAYSATATSKVSTDATAATVSASSTAVTGSHTLNITRLATTSNAVSSTAVSDALVGGDITLPVDFGTGKDFNITLNGTTKNIKLTGSYASIGDASSGLVKAVQDAVNTSFGTGKITIGNSGNALTFTSVATSAGKLELATGTTDALASLSFSNGATNRISTSTTLANLNTVNNPIFDGDTEVKFSINGTDFSFASTTSLSNVMSAINSSAANVTMSYSEVADKFTLTSKTYGAGQNIDITNTSGNFFGAASITGLSNTQVSEGLDAQVTIDGTALVRSSNNFSVDGITYNLNRTTTGSVTNDDITINVGQDVDTVYNKIKSFIDKYNEVISNINTKLSEERDTDYTPLTDDQRAAMSETDIATWESKAKSGLLRNDSMLNSISYNLRRTLSDSIAGVTGSLASIGISTGAFSEKGKLSIDETKLKAAIRDNPDKVAGLFANESSTVYSRTLTSSQRATRYSESGFVSKMYDIIQDNISILRDNNGKKGSLLEKAGFVGDITEYNNIIYSDMKTQDTLISALATKISDKETALYTKFSAMEKALAAMNSQSSWLSQQTSG